MSRLPALAIAPVLLAACQNVPSPPDLEPLEEPRALEAAPPRVSGAIPVDRSKERSFTAQAVGATPAVMPPPTPGAGAQAGGEGEEACGGGGMKGIGHNHSM